MSKHKTVINIIKCDRCEVPLGLATKVAWKNKDDTNHLCQKCYLTSVGEEYIEYI